MTLNVRRRIRSTVVVACAMVLAGQVGVHSASAQVNLDNVSTELSKRPNVIIIFADDFGLGETGCYGGRVATPHIDSLARDGLRFLRFYVNSTVCSPSRYTLLSGRFASRSTRLHESYPPGGPVTIGWEPSVYGEKNTLPLLLQRAGYVTGCVGKWHQGGASGLAEVAPDADPLAEETLALLKDNYAKHIRAVKECGFDYADGIYYTNPGGPGKKGECWLPAAWRVHNPEWVTTAALDFLKQNKEKPFFLYMSTTLIHSPNALASLRHADPRATPAGLIAAPPDVQPARDNLLQRAERKRRAAAIIWLDDSVGAVLGKLDELGLADDTIVIFASDNGPYHGKNTCYDLGARLPLLMRWPGGVVRAGVRDALVSSIDIAPTLYALCGVMPPPEAVVDGMSFAPLVTGQGTYRRESVMLEIGATRAVVSEDGFKYIATRFTKEIQARIDGGEKFTQNGYPYGKHKHTYRADKHYSGYFDLDQLYDLNIDVKEQWNEARSDEQRARLAALKAELKRYSLRLPHTFGEFTE